MPENLWETVKNFVFDTLGHAVSGAVVGAFYEATQVIGNQVMDVNTLLTAALIGGSIGFFKAIVDSLELMKKSEPKVTASGKPKKPARHYFGV